MKIYLNRLAFVLLIVTFALQLLIAWIGNNINNDKVIELDKLRITATAKYLVGTASGMVNQQDLTFTPTIDTRTPVPVLPTCEVEVRDVSATIYTVPADGVIKGSIILEEGERITLTGKLRNEPWWKVLIPKANSFGWIKDEGINVNTECDNLIEVDLVSLLEANPSASLIIQDTFNGFDYDWRGLNEMPNQRPVTDGIASLHVVDRSSALNSEEIAGLRNFGLPSPFGFMVALKPFSFYNNSYIGFRYNSASEPDKNWIEFRLIRRYCAVIWRYSILGEVVENPMFTLGEEVGCGNDDLADFLHVELSKTENIDALRFKGDYNGIPLPSLTIFDREQIFQTGTFELVVSKSDVLFDYLLFYEINE